jgi:hypothetical protein
VAYGSGTFAAVADNGAILTSPDGAVWTRRSSGTHSTLLAIAHGGKEFIAAGENGSLIQSESLPLPKISVSATSIDFGSVNVGNSSSQNLTITNVGAAGLVIRQMTIGGVNSPDFTIQNNTCSGTTLPPSGDCAVQIVFAPLSTGSKSATLSIASNDPNTPTQTVALSGTSSGVSVSSTGSSCFISLVARGSGLEKHLDTLRKIRDTFLLKSKLGKKLVSLYYKYSPPLANFMDRHDFLREFVRGALVPLAAITYVAFQASPVERTFLMALMIGLMTEGFILWSKSRGAREARRGISVEAGV